ncbi:hypothetical protein DPMN_171322 [Dreissena polymorpha]|uniref:Uncharacterized protein n=1 Tax=Dreissena polymorpha TaxID=45954 RepID=A0A9D4IFG6_DREPO|nr:hypothetical protein DPMN_171322 [Dreissena polymorpha]
MIEDIQQTHVTASKSLKSSTKQMKRNYDLRVLLRPYAEGDVVYILDTAVLKRKCKKCTMERSGANYPIIYKNCLRTSTVFD